MNMLLVSVRQWCTSEICLAGTPIPSTSAPCPTPSPVFPSLLPLPFLLGSGGITPGENFEIPHARTCTLVNFRAKLEQ